MEQEHTKAAETHAVERYALGEMTEDERLAFEDHYFDCRICAAEVTYAMQMMSAGQVVAREDQSKKVVPMPSRSRRWFPQAAAAALILSVVGNGYQYLTRTAQVMPAVAVVPIGGVHVEIETEPVRNEAPAEATTVRAGSLALDLFIPTGEGAAGYVCEIRDSDGKTLYSYPVSAKAAADPVSLPCVLPAGKYFLVIEGVRKDGTRFPISRNSINVVGER